MEVYNLLNNDNLTINKLTRYIKHHNKGDVFSLILNMIPYPILIKWVYELNVMRYYWNDNIITKLIELNKFTLKILYLNKNYDKAYKHLITLNNQYNLYYNYTDNIIQKRYKIIISKLKEVFDEILKDYNFDEIIFGSDFVNLIGNNQFFKNINKDIVITLYFKNNIHFKSETELLYRYPYYYLKYDNITFKFFESNASINDIYEVYVTYVFILKTQESFIAD
jgi:hypothetical protein